MDEKSVQREIKNILASILFLSLGFLVVWFTAKYLNTVGDIVIMSLLFLPVLVYLIFSGRLSQLKAGGLEAKFLDITDQSMEIASETITPLREDIEIVGKEGVKELQNRVPHLDESKPIILTLNLGTGGYYVADKLLLYIEVLSQYPTFKFVVFMDKDNRFVAYIPSWAMLQILKIKHLGIDFVRRLNDGDFRELRRYPGIVTKTISTKSTNMDALREMTAQNLDALIVMDEERKIKGVVEKDQLLSKILLGMAK